MEFKNLISLVIIYLCLNVVTSETNNLGWINPLCETSPGSYATTRGYYGYCFGIENCTEKICSNFNTEKSTIVLSGYETNGFDYCSGYDDDSLCYQLLNNSTIGVDKTVRTPTTVYGLSIKYPATRYHMTGSKFNCTSSLECITIICQNYCDSNTDNMLWAFKPEFCQKRN